MKKINYMIFLLMAFTVLTIGCKDNPLPEPEDQRPQANPVTLKVNHFIEDVMDYIYLWNTHMPDLDVRYETNSEEYFDKLLYEEDKWSFITDDAQALEDSFEGVETSFGYSLVIGEFSNSDGYFAIVEYVYPDTPADEAGIVRGDIILSINENELNANNYRDLFYAPSLKIGFGVYTGAGIGTSGRTVQMTARKLNLDPVMITNIIEHDGHKIGYLFYTQYIGRFNNRLDEAFAHFKQEGVTDLILDLRYNPGGDINAALHLCSMVAPASVINNQDVLITYHYNEIIQKEIELEEGLEGLKVRFNKNVPANLDLNEVYILTGTGTASASELTITGLKPYMNVVTVGQTTFGKYTVSTTIKPENVYRDEAHYQDIATWAIQPIIARFANAQNVTDFKDGFAPDISVQEEILDGIPLGAKEDPLVMAAIEDITGTELFALKKARIDRLEFTVIDRGFSKFDRNKRELLLNEMTFEKLNK